MASQEAGNNVVIEVLDGRFIDRDEHVMRRDLVRQVPLVRISLYMKTVYPLILPIFIHGNIGLIHLVINL